MQIEVDQDGVICLREVYSGVRLETAEGNRIGCCMRDDTIEISILPAGEEVSVWWRVDMESRTIFPMGGTGASPDESASTGKAAD